MAAEIWALLNSIWIHSLSLCHGDREKGMELQRSMVREGVEPNQVTKQLLVAVGKGGTAAIGDQQVAAAALSAAVAAAGSLIIRAGAF